MTPRSEVKQFKLDAVEALNQEFGKASSAVFVDYTGMNMALLGELRDKLRESGGKMLVAKNTFIKIAGEQSGFPQEALVDEVLSGQTAVVIGYEDAVSPIQILGKFAKEKEFPKVKAGVVEGQFQTEANVIAISKMPGRDVLQAQVVGAISSPLYGLVGTLQGNLTKLVFILKQKAGDLS